MHQNPYQPPSAGFGPPSAIPTGTGEYEFSDYENAVIEKLAGRVRWWGMLSIVFGSLACLGILGMGLTLGAALTAAEGPVGLLVIGGTLVVLAPVIIVYLVTGGLYVGSGRALKSVVSTRGNDVDHMLAALEKMGRAFWIEILTTILGFGLAIVGVIGLFIAAASLDAAM